MIVRRANASTDERRQHRRHSPRLQIVFAMLLAGAMTGPACAAMTVTVNATGLHIAGVTARGAVAVEGVLWEKEGGQYVDLREESALVEDTDGDGVVDFDLKRPLSVRAIFAVVDTDSGDVQIVTPPAYPRRILPVPAGFVRGTAAGDVDEIVGDRLVLRVLWVSPRHKGAWVLRTADGGGNDSDGSNNGHTVSLTTAFRPLMDGDKPPKKLKTGDVLVAIDPFDMAFFSTAVTK